MLIFVVFSYVTLRQKNIIKRKEIIVREKSNDLLGILNNIHQGVVTIPVDVNGPKGIQDTSSYFFKIFENLDSQRSTDLSPVSYLFKDSSLNDEQLTTIESVLLSSGGEEIIQWDLNRDHLPKEMILDNKKTLELGWSVVQENGIVSKVIITFKDVTEMRALNERDKENQINLKKLISLSLMDQKEYFLIYSSMTKMLSESVDIISEHDTLQKEVLNSVNRNLHTIKGIARNYDLNDLSSLIHDKEGHFQKTKACEVPYDQELCLTYLKEIQSDIKTYDDLAKEKLKWDNKTLSTNLNIDVLRHWYQSILKAHQRFKGESGLSEILVQIKKTYASTFEDSLKSIIRNSKKLALELDKGDVKFLLSGCDVFISQKIADRLESIFIHLIRNSIDHGFLSSEERIQNQLPSPEIAIRLSKQNNEYQVELFDNGTGINLNSVIKRAESHSLSFDRSKDIQVANLIFEAGFSTKKSTTEISGRGVGMDAVKHMVEELGGSIEIVPNGEAKGGFLPTKFQINFPPEFAAA